MEVLHCRYLFLGVFFSEHICIPAFTTTQILSWLADGQACVFSKLLHSPSMPAYLILPLRNYCWQAGHYILPLVQEGTKWSSFDARCHKNNLLHCFLELKMARKSTLNLQLLLIFALYITSIQFYWFTNSVLAPGSSVCFLFSFFIVLADVQDQVITGLVQSGSFLRAHIDMNAEQLGTQHCS